MDVAKLRTLVKPLVRGVLLKVHPDFFSHSPAARQTNQASVQRLQDLMAPVLKDQKAGLRSASADTPLEFFCKDNADTKVTFAFMPTAHRVNGPRQQHSLAAQRTRDLIQLCKRLDVPASEETVAEIEKTIGPAMSAAAGASGPLDPASLNALRAARAREARQNYARYGKRPDPRAELMEKLRQVQWAPDLAPFKHAQLRLDRSKLFFEKSVDPRRYAAIADSIESELHDLGYRHWCSLPVMVVKDWRSAFKNSTTKYPGFVVIPANYNVTGTLRVACQ
ncbi:hypothetical protein GGI07_001015 [Coemansia sp. Benny D115]|nr:hypothetical protein GGI07_001015 [Coemansia sp. Benny D115]